RGYMSLAQMASINDDKRPIASDDWLVSPELYGGPQTVRFYALSLNDAYGNDTFEVYYSTGGNSYEDMKPIMHSTVVPTQWTRYMVSLPDGARHFAIRCTSNNCYMMLLDDITFIAPGQPRELTLKGYNVYCNYAKINDEPLTATEFSVDRGSDDDVYYVTALYEQGESVASNLIGIAILGVDEITADESVEPEYFDMRGVRVGKDGNLAPGVYLCRRGSKVEKIVIR
ncbi:MAG: choice-of-anchor J domain-containing protein, partial [Paramuribaculum sp.]|nr:choice-of-anchor J domain-containing protein [Paramuribaculum sp.]